MKSRARQGPAGALPGEYHRRRENTEGRWAEARKNREPGTLYHKRMTRVTAMGGHSASVLSQRFVRYTTVLRGFRLGARRATTPGASGASPAYRIAGGTPPLSPRGPRGRPPHTVAGGTPPLSPRGPRKTALRVAFPASSGRRERLTMAPHRRRVPSCRGNGKIDRIVHESLRQDTGSAPPRDAGASREPRDDVRWPPEGSFFAPFGGVSAV